jgi:hypothetical protein
MEFIVDLELLDENIQPEPAKPSRAKLGIKDMGSFKGLWG